MNQIIRQQELLKEFSHTYNSNMNEKDKLMTLGDIVLFLAESWFRKETIVKTLDEINNSNIDVFSKIEKLKACV